MHVKTDFKNQPYFWLFDRLGAEEPSFFWITRPWVGCILDCWPGRSRGCSFPCCALAHCKIGDLGICSFGVAPSSRICARALGIPSTPRSKGRLEENASKLSTVGIAVKVKHWAHNQRSVGMKGSKGTMRKNRNNKQMWKSPGTTHIAIVSYGLGMLKDKGWNPKWTSTVILSGMTTQIWKGTK